MNTSNHLLVLSQPDFIERQLGTSLAEASAASPGLWRRPWLWLSQR